MTTTIAVGLYSIQAVYESKKNWKGGERERRGEERERERGERREERRERERERGEEREERGYLNDIETELYDVF